MDNNYQTTNLNDFNNLNENNSDENIPNKDSLDFNTRSQLVDIRIVFTNMDYIEPISKAVSNFDLSNFNVNISSIIPTGDVEIAKNTIIGADLVLIAVESNADGKELFRLFKKALKTDYNFIEYLKLPSFDEFNDYEYDYEEDNLFEDEIANSIIRAGLHSISNLSSINESKRSYHRIKNDFENSISKSDKLSKENAILINESKTLREKNEKLLENVRILQKDLDSIKSDYSDLKSRFESIHSKNSLEVFSLKDLWESLFNESFGEEIYRFILISTDNFRPKNLMIGQGVICAESREDALDWLKIIKTAFILRDTNKKEFDFNNFNSNFRFEDTDNESNAAEFSSDDDFIHNERFKGDTKTDSDFRDLNFNRDFNLDDDENKFDEFDNTLKKEDSNIFISGQRNDSEGSEDINVFNLKSLKSISSEDDSEEDIDDGDDYSYDDEEIEDEDYTPFSNFWG